MEFRRSNSSYSGYSALAKAAGGYLNDSSMYASAPPRAYYDASPMGSPRFSSPSYESSPSPSSSGPQTPNSSYSWSSSPSQPRKPRRVPYDGPAVDMMDIDGANSYDLTSHLPTLSPNLASTYSSASLQAFVAPVQYTMSPAPAAFLPGRRGPHVPQKAYSTHYGSSGAPKRINFKLQGSPESGVPMRLLLGEFAPETPIEDAHGIPFAEGVASTITLRIWWPGYDVFPRRLTMRKTSGLLTRIELAMMIAECFRSFMEEARPKTSSGQDGYFKVGKSGIQVHDLVLLRLCQVSQGSFQADVQLELERQ